MKQILDPLSCLCKLGMLSYYDIGTKISINNNVVHIQNNDSSQWIKRTYHGDNKDDVCVLYNPILKAIEWYVFHKTTIENNKNEDDNEDKLSEEENEAITNIIEHAIIGLSKLQVTYDDGNVVLAIQFLKNNLKMALKEGYTIEQFVSFNEIEETDHLLNYDRIREIWKSENILNISNQLKLCDSSDDEALKLLLQSLNSTLKSKDLKFKSLVNMMNSSL
jgi:hypothetical protein